MHFSFMRHLVIAGLALAPATAVQAVFVDDPMTGGLWHFDEAVSHPEFNNLLVLDDNSVTGRTPRNLELINDAAGASIVDGSYDGTQVQNAYLRSVNPYSSFFADPAHSLIVEAEFTVAPVNVLGHNQEIAAVVGGFLVRLVRHDDGAIPDLTLWRADTNAPQGYRFSGPAMHLQPNDTHFLRFVVDHEAGTASLTIDDRTQVLPLVGGGMIAPPENNQLFVGIRGGDRFLGQIHELKISQIPEPAALSLLALAGAGLLARRRRR